MDQIRRNFMKGMVSATVVGSVLLVPGGRYLFEKEAITEPCSTEPCSTKQETDTSFLNYDYLSNAASGSMAAGIILDNLEHIYLFLLCLVALCLFTTTGIPFIESLIFPNPEQIIIK